MQFFEWMVMQRERNLLKKPYVKGILHMERCLEGVQLCVFAFLRKSRTHKLSMVEDGGIKDIKLHKEGAQFCTLKEQEITPTYIFLAKTQCFQNTAFLEEEFLLGHVWGRVL